MLKPRHQIEIGLRLEETRKALGLSQEEFAELGRVKKVSQYLYEKGSRIPNGEYFAHLCALGVDVAWVLVGDKQKKSTKRYNLNIGAPLPNQANYLAKQVLAVHKMARTIQQTRKKQNLPALGEEHLFRIVCAAMYADNSNSTLEILTST